MHPKERKERLGAALRCLKSGIWFRTEANCREILKHHPDDTEALLLLGLGIAAGGEPTRAAPLLHRVASERPDLTHPCEEFARLQPAVADALVPELYRACLALDPHSTRLRRDFAHLLIEQGEADEAAEILLGALDTAEGLNLMGLARAEQARFAEAVGFFQQSVVQDPQPAGAWSNLGMMLKIERRHDEALHAYDEAVAREPENPRIRVNRAVALLHGGHWAEAWPDYEWRLRLPGHEGLPIGRLLPSLEADDDLFGMTVLVTHEEGFGDTLQFMRYLPMLSERGARVVVRVPDQLARIARTLPGVSRVLTSGQETEDYDVHCPFFSLPRVFGTTLDTIPGTPYIKVDPELVTHWRSAMPEGAFHVGLVWAGQARPWLQGFSTLDRRRSVGLAALAPLAGVSGARFVSLQAGNPAAAAIDPPPGLTIFDPMDSVRDFADTAGIIANLDVVVSVDTSVAHLAGAMGKKVLLLDRYDNCWRWLHDRNDTPWYPSMTLFRQTTPDDWTDPVHRVVAALQGMAAFRGLSAAPPHPSRRPALANAA